MMAPSKTLLNEIESRSDSADKSKPTLYLLEEFHPDAVKYCQSIFHTVLPTDSEIANWRQNATAIMMREMLITAKDIKECKKLRVIGKQGAGIDVIDQSACKDRGITILNTPGVNASTVAELVVALTFGVARQLRPISIGQFQGLTVKKSDCLGLNIIGKSVGIIGMGPVGATTAEIFCRGFRCEIYAYDPFVPVDVWGDLPHKRVEKIEEMLPSVDVLSLHVPLTKDTRGLISWPQFQMMKETTILINAARGGVVNEDDLLRALNEGVIWGAGLDCHEEEPPTMNKYQDLWATGKVLSTPHIGATTGETQVKTAVAAMDRIQKFLLGTS